MFLITSPLTSKFLRQCLQILVFFTLLAACGSQKEKPSYGLKKASLTISNPSLAKLHSTLSQKPSVSGSLAIDGKTYQVLVSHSGKSTLFHPKRNFHIELQNGDLYRGLSAFRLSSQSSDPSGLRSMLGLLAFKNAQVESPAVEPVSLYLNDKFLGLYFYLELVDEKWLRNKGFRPLSIYKARYGRLDYANFDEETTNHLKQGFANKSSHDSYEDLKRLIRNLNDGQKAPEALVDKENYLNYMATAVTLNHWDGFDNNFFFFKDAKKELFYIVPWDLDKILPQSGYDYKPSGYLGENALTQHFLASAAAKKEHKERILNLLAGPLSTQTLEAQIDAFAVTINNAYQMDPYLNPNGEGMAPAILKLKESLRRRAAALKSDLLKP